MLALSALWPWLKNEYQAWIANYPEFGTRLKSSTSEGLYILHLLAQRMSPDDQGRLVRLDALRSALSHVALRDHQAEVHMPRIGCGIGGAVWSDIEPILNETLIAAGIPVYVYDL